MSKTKGCGANCGKIEMVGGYVARLLEWHEEFADFLLLLP